MKSLLQIVMCLVAAYSVAFSLTIDEYKIDAFAVLEDTGSSGTDGDYIPFGVGVIISYDDCFYENYLLCKPELLVNRRKIYVSVVHSNLESDRGIHPVSVEKNGNPLWASLNTDMFSLAMLPMIELLATDIHSIDTTDMKFMSDIEMGDEVVYLEYLKSFSHTDSWNSTFYYPIARKSIVSFVPKIAYFDPYPDTQFTIPDTVIYIDGEIGYGAIGSPVFSVPKNRSNRISFIGILEGPLGGPDSKLGLGVVIPTDEILKLIEFFRGCER
jgi:hypothetical protein